MGCIECNGCLIENMIQAVTIVAKHGNLSLLFVYFLQFSPQLTSVLAAARHSQSLICPKSQKLSLVGIGNVMVQ